MKILSCADIHMGRIPSVLNSANMTGSTSWEAVVEKAISLHVEVLVLAGDVVEQEQAWFEAYGPLVRGLEQLGNAGIQVIGVGGNHDAKIFPRLANESKDIKILGLGGVWEYFDYQEVRFVGWSFPGNHHQENPLAGFDPSMTLTDKALLGILHCEANASPVYSKYAPVSVHDFARTNIPWWVLGHIHKPGTLPSAKALYCGSPYALDSNEKGVHGVWLLETLAGSQWKTPQFIPICPYRFETCSVDLSKVSTDEEVQTSLTKSLRDFGSTLEGEEAVLCHLVLEGTIGKQVNLKRILTPENLRNFAIPLKEHMLYTLPDFEDHTELMLNLEELTQGAGPVALLARKLLDPACLSDLASKYQRLDEESFNASAYHLLNNEHVENDYTLLAKNAGKRLLAAMLASSEGSQL